MGLFNRASKSEKKAAPAAACTCACGCCEAAEEVIAEPVAEPAEETVEEVVDEIAAEEAVAEDAVEDAVVEEAADAVEEAATEETVAEEPVVAVEETVAEEPVADAAVALYNEVLGYDTLHVIDHPMVQHKLTIMRETETGAKDFRQLLEEIALLVGYEVTRDLPLKDVEIDTPIQKTVGKAIAGKKLAIVPILRAGLGMVDGLLSLVPAAKVGHIGLYRHPETHQPVEYYCKLPDDISNRLVIVTDPMLATGGSAVDAVRMLKEKGCTDLRMMCLVAAPEGIKAMHEAHPDVPIFTAALDERLNERAYIVPGLGDAGDRLFGTN